MLADRGFRYLEELRQLQIGEPDSLPVQTNANLGNLIVRLVNDDLRRFVFGGGVIGVHGLVSIGGIAAGGGVTQCYSITRHIELYRFFQSPGKSDLPPFLFQEY